VLTIFTPYDSRTKSAKPYTYMYIRSIYIYIHTYMCVCVCASIHLSIYIHICVYINQVYIYIHHPYRSISYRVDNLHPVRCLDEIGQSLYICVYTKYIYIHTYICVCVCIYPSIYIYTYMCKYKCSIYIYTTHISMSYRVDNLHAVWLLDEIA